MRIAVVALSAATLAAASTTAHAQVVRRRIAEEPTAGIALPTAPLAGEVDGRTVAMNPGGLTFVRGRELALALDLEDLDVATSSGPGFGAFAATAFGGGFLPRLGVGIGVEWLRPPRDELTPDPGTPVRFTAAAAIGLFKHAGLGASWHHFVDDTAIDGVDAFDLGASVRFGGRLAAGAVVRDVGTAAIAGAPVQRRYELELVARPTGTDRLDLGIGGRIGETRLDTDGWIRGSLRVARGVFVQGALETREVHTLTDTVAGTIDDDRRDARATLGLELSFGGKGATVLGTGLRDDHGDYHALGGQLVLRLSSTGPASVIGEGAHLERVDLAGEIGLRELTAIVARMRSIARDPAAAGVVIAFDGVGGGWATMQELRDEVTRLRAAGKHVYAYMVNGTGRDYFIASAATKIYLDPAGGLRLVGMAGTSVYFRGLFDQLGVVPQFEKIAEFKSAPEQFTETHPTETAAKMNTELFDSLWAQWLTQTAAGRGLSEAELMTIIDNGPYTSGDLDAPGTPVGKLVDGIGAPDKISELVARDMGRVLPVDAPVVPRPDRWTRPGIAIVYVDGDITDGVSRSVPFLGKHLAGGETLVRALAEARGDPRIGAIILRIDSPGGSALASELVAREVFATRGVKPMLCSMSDLAASGGYFVAAGCDLIFAEPMTITGSIGIFFGKFDLSGLAAKLGITTTTYKHGARSDAESMFRPYTEDERAAMMRQLQYMYGRFVGAVAEGRTLSKAAVDGVGRGHVWSGAMARPIKLVDRFGGLGDAIDEAKRRMGISLGTQVQLYELPAPPASLFNALGRLVGVSAAVPGASASDVLDVTAIPAVRELLDSVPVGSLLAPHAAQARLPYDLDWQ